MFSCAWCHVFQVTHASAHVVARERALATAVMPRMCACVARNVFSVLAVWVGQGAVVKETQFPCMCIYMPITILLKSHCLIVVQALGSCLASHLLAGALHSVP